MNLKHIIITTILVLLMCGTASAWLSGHDHRMAITVNNGGGSTLNYYQFNFTNDTNVLVAAGHMQASGADCRITDTSDNLIPFWNETAFNAAGTKIWANDTLTVGDNTFYMYYGNAAASSVVGGDATFEFFDDFPGGGGVDFGRWHDNKYASNPVITPTEGTAGIDDLGTAWGYFMTVGANDYRMYYCGISGSDYDICLATSTDRQTWTRITNGIDGTHKVIDDASAWAGPVWKEGATYHMLYKSTVPSTYTWYHVTSADGISWGTKTQCTGTGGTEASSIMKIGSTYHVWGSGASPAKVYHFTSTDLEAWTIQNSGNPVLEVSGSNVICPDIFYNVDDSKYYIVAAVTPYGAGFPENHNGVYRMWKADDLDFQTNLEVIGDILIFDDANKDLLPDWEDGGSYDGQHFIWPDVYKQISNTDELYYYYSVKHTLAAPYAFVQGLVYFSTGGAAITKAGEIPPGIDLDKWTLKANAYVTLSGGIATLKSTDGSSSGMYTKVYNHPSDGVIIEYEGKRGTSYSGGRPVGSMSDVTAMHKGGGGLGYYDAATQGLKCWNYAGTSGVASGTIDNIFYDMKTYLKPTEIKITGAGLTATIANTLVSHPIGIYIPDMNGWFIKNFRVRKYAAIEPTSSFGAEEDAPTGNNDIVLGANKYGMLRKDVTTAQTFSTIAGGFTHDVCFTWWDDVTDTWLSYWVGDTYNSAQSVPEHESYFVLMDSTGETVSCSVATAENVNIPIGWSSTYLRESASKTLTAIKSDMGGNCAYLYAWDHTAGGTGAWTNTGSFSVLPNQGLLVSASAGFNWDGSVP